MSEQELEFWGGQLYTNRTKNLSELKSRMWTVMQWAITLNAGIAAAALTDEFQEYRYLLGVSSIGVSAIAVAFILYLHNGVVQQRRNLEDIKPRFGSVFMYIHGKQDPTRLCWTKDWYIWFFQVMLVVATGVGAAWISLDLAITFAVGAICQ